MTEWIQAIQKRLKKCSGEGLSSSVQHIGITFKIRYLPCLNARNEKRNTPELFREIYYDDFANKRIEVWDMEYMSIQQAAEQWGLSSRRIQQLCKSGAIVGAVKVGRTWQNQLKYSIGLL